MEIAEPTSWPTTAAAAEELQEQLRHLVDPHNSGKPIRTVAGLDAAYEPGTDRMAACVAVLDASDHRILECRTMVDTARFPYFPGLFAFRELPALLRALELVTVVPDLLMCDGSGLAHPRRFGLACHAGVLTGIPSIGVTKTSPFGYHEPPGPKRGDISPIRDGDDILGYALRTVDQVRPLFVSVGHRISLTTARHHVLAASPRYRVPEPIRQADYAARQALSAARTSDR